MFYLVVGILSFLLIWNFISPEFSHNLGPVKINCPDGSVAVIPDRSEGHNSLQLTSFKWGCRSQSTKEESKLEATTTEPPYKGMCFSEIAVRDIPTGQESLGEGKHPNMRFFFTGANQVVCVHSSCSCQVIAGDKIGDRFEVVSVKPRLDNHPEYPKSPLCSGYADGYKVFPLDQAQRCKVIR